MEARIVMVIAAFLLLLLLYLGARRRTGRLAKRVSDISLLLLVASVVVFAFLRPFVLDMYIIPSSSMAPALEPGDQIFVNKFIYKYREPRFGEVIIFRAPPWIPGAGKDILIKRVIGLPGDEIMVARGLVFRNGKPLNEPYIPEPPFYVQKPIKVPPGYIYVLGDNRNASDDSSRWGPAPRNLVMGRATVIFWPPARAGYIP